ncbi:unnamed protein product [Amoebophrya sp. A120]|nr:unnamed protein product [Amoebophrya sp. A120]|eukprot:GSA120T00012669001.1
MMFIHQSRNKSRFNLAPTELLLLSCASGILNNTRQSYLSILTRSAMIAIATFAFLFHFGK